MDKKTNVPINKQRVGRDFAVENFHRKLCIFYAGNKITTIMRVENVFDYHKFIDKLCNYEN